MILKSVQFLLILVSIKINKWNKYIFLFRLTKNLIEPEFRTIIIKIVTGIVQPKMKVLSSFSHPQVVPNPNHQ